MKKNVVITILVLIILGLGSYITYDKFLEKDNTNNEKDIINNNNKNEENIKNETSDDRYNEYLKNLENVTNKHFQKVPDVSDEELANLDSKKYYSQQSYCSSTANNEIEYCISLDNKILSLQLSNNDESTIKLSDDVLNYFIVNVGQAGYKNLYYITTAGKVYEVNHEMQIDEGVDNLSKKELNLKNIVNVIGIDAGLLSSSGDVAFIDIDGNLFTFGENDKIEQLN